MSIVVERLTHRLQRAIDRAAPRFAAAHPETASDGHWLNDRAYFFVAWLTEEDGIIVPIPSIAELPGPVIRTVVESERLCAMLSQALDTSVTAIDLAGAQFAMPASERLTVAVREHSILLDTKGGTVLKCEPAVLRKIVSPDGRHTCFVSGEDLALRDHATGAERQLTSDGAPYRRFGQEADTCLAALSYRSSPTPCGLWSADSRWFFTHRIDESAVPFMPLIENVPSSRLRPQLHQYRVPLPGDPVPTITYVALDSESDRQVTFDEFAGPMSNFSPFSQRWAWSSDDNRLWALRFDRFRRSVELLCLDPESGTGRVVLSETAIDGSITLNPMNFRTPNVRTLTATREVIWYSERDGWGHLYLYNAESGALKNRITTGPWVVRDIVDVDEDRRKLLLLAGALDPDADPMQRTLCVIDLDGGNFRVLCAAGRGDVYVSPTGSGLLTRDESTRVSDTGGVSPGRGFAAVRIGSAIEGNRLELVGLQDGATATLHTIAPEADAPKVHAIMTLAADGETLLHGLLYLPPDFTEERSYPLVDYLYPGPQTAHKPQSFGTTNAAQARSLAELGFAVLMLDTRGMPGASRARHIAGYRHLLEPQLADHAAAVRQLRQRHPFLDPDRTGVLGWSGGGAAAARAMFDYADVYSVGVAVCGNHDSSRYSAAWSDRFRGPGDPAVWTGDSNMAHAHRLRGKLLLLSGDMDENVHVSQTLVLADALIDAGSDFDMMIVPNAGHDVLMTSSFAQRRVWAYLVRHLLGCELPNDSTFTFSPTELAAYHTQATRELLQ